MKTISRKIVALIIAVLATSVLAIGISLAVPEQSHAYSPAFNNNRPSSGKLIIGDSRAYDMGKSYEKYTSCVGLVSGHYGFGGENFQIDSPRRLATINNCIKTTIKKKGYCRVYIFPAVGDFSVGSYAATSTDNLVAFAKKISQLRYGKKKPTVTVLSMIPPKGKNSTNYNKILKSKVAKVKGLKYKAINNYRCGGNGGYYKPSKLGLPDAAMERYDLNLATIKKIYTKAIK